MTGTTHNPTRRTRIMTGDHGGGGAGGREKLALAGEMGRPRVRRRWMSGMRCVHSEKSVP
jgi:hypothetical protein